jgi:hypothetical protein
MTIEVIFWIVAIIFQLIALLALMDAAFFGFSIISFLEDGIEELKNFFKKVVDR